MKKLLVMLVAVGFIAGTANAATLWMQFADGSDEVTLAPSQTVDVQIFVDMLPADTLAGVTGQFWPFGTADQGAYPTFVEGLDDMGIVANPALGWDSGSGVGPLGSAATNINVGAPTAAQAISGAGSFMVGTMTLHQNDLQNIDSTYFPDFYPVMFGGDPSALPNLIMPSGSKFKFDPRYSSSYAGYYTWGQGASGIVKPKYTVEADPLIVHCIPEPASLALLALGGLALIRRR